METVFISKNHTCLKVSSKNKTTLNFHMLTTPDEWTCEENKLDLTKKDVKKLIDFLKIFVE